MGYADVEEEEWKGSGGGNGISLPFLCSENMVGLC